MVLLKVRTVSLLRGNTSTAPAKLTEFYLSRKRFKESSLQQGYLSEVKCVLSMCMVPGLISNTQTERFALQFSDRFAYLPQPSLYSHIRILLYSCYFNQFKSKSEEVYGRFPFVITFLPWGRQTKM